MRKECEDYRIHAEQCVRMAERSSFSEVRLHWLQLASAWRALWERHTGAQAAGDESGSN
jgi:hypothetical protein